MKRVLHLIIAPAVVLIAGTAFGTQAVFQNGTATLSQTCAGVHSPDLSIDGDLSFGNRGWAIFDCTSNPTTAQTAVWETSGDVAATQLDFRIHQNWSGTPYHLLGRFRLSVTTDDRSTFADDLDTGGDVSASWTVLINPTVSGPAGMTFTTLGDNSILVGGAIPSTGVYDISYTGSFAGVTGVRLEVMEDPSLPTSGPGLHPNGNFVLTEIELFFSGDPTISTEPTSWGRIKALYR